MAALIVALLVWSYSDVLIWQRVFEAHRLFQYEAPYHVGWMLSLVGLIGIGALTLPWRWGLWYAGALLTIGFSGFEDWLYYLLDGRSLPAMLPWLNDHALIWPKPVSAVSVIASSLFWIGLGALTWSRCLPGRHQASSGRNKPPPHRNHASVLVLRTPTVNEITQ